MPKSLLCWFARVDQPGLIEIHVAIVQYAGIDQRQPSLVSPTLHHLREWFVGSWPLVVLHSCSLKMFKQVILSDRTVSHEEEIIDQTLGKSWLGQMATIDNYCGKMQILDSGPVHLESGSLDQ